MGSSNEIRDAAGRAKLFSGILGRKPGPELPSDVFYKPPPKQVVVEPRQIEEPIELDDQPLTEKDLDAIDVALKDGLEIVIERITPSSSVRSAIIENPAEPKIRYGGFGRTAEFALRMAAERMIEGRIGVSNPSQEVLSGASKAFLTPMDRSTADQQVDNSGTKINVRKYSKFPADPVVVAIRGGFHRGASFMEAWASVPSPEIPLSCGA